MRDESRLWYGWVVLAVVYLAMITLIAFRATIGPFFKEISGELGWSRGATAAAFSIGMLAQAVISPLAGILSDRWSIRATMSAGVLVFGLSLLIGSSNHRAVAFLSDVRRPVRGLRRGHVGRPGAHALELVREKKRVRLGDRQHLRREGPSCLNIATPYLIAALGWRMSYLALAGITLLIVLPICIVFHRDHPSDKGTIADAPFVRDAPDKPTQKSAPSSAGDPQVSLFNLPFFFFLGSFLPMAYAFSGMLVHLVPHATDQGFSLQTASVLFAIWGLCQVAANLISPVSDRLGRAPTFLVGVVLGIASAFVLATYEQGDPQIRFYLGTMTNGLALGLMRPTGSAILADYFEGPGFGRVNGVAMMAFALWGSAGPWTTGALFDLHGSYFWGLSVLAFMFFLCGVFVLLLGWMKKDKREQSHA